MGNPIGTPLPDDVKAATAKELQAILVDLISLSLYGKQLHWHVTGRNFKSVHEQLDLIIVDARLASDEIAERSITIGVPIDGRPAAVAADHTLPDVGEGWIDVTKAVALYADEVTATVARLRSAVGVLEVEPATQDLVIATLQTFEKHLWMLQAQLAD